MNNGKLMILLLALLYIKIIWMGIWTVWFLYPDPIDIVWSIAVIILDLLLLFVFCKNILGLNFMATSFVIISIILSILIIDSELVFLSNLK